MIGFARTIVYDSQDITPFVRKKQREGEIRQKMFLQKTGRRPSDEEM